jgi:ADP-ribose pyrophosphatase YjhB (NUDIX family)
MAHIGQSLVSDASKEKVCLIRHITNQNQTEWILPKGRRNCGESRKAAALREVEEETGYKCELLPVTMSTRAPADSEPTDVKDEPRTYDQLTEHFMTTVRSKGDRDLKFIYWFIAIAVANPRSAGETKFSPNFFMFSDALVEVTFEDDRKCLQGAYRLVHR